MPDITMCHGEKDGTACPERDKCYRYTAKPSEFMQAWFKVAPFNETGCDLLMPNRERKG